MHPKFISIACVKTHHRNFQSLFKGIIHYGSIIFQILLNHSNFYSTEYNVAVFITNQVSKICKKFNLNCCNYFVTVWQKGFWKANMCFWIQNISFLSPGPSLHWGSWGCDTPLEKVSVAVYCLKYSKIAGYFYDFSNVPKRCGLLFRYLMILDENS